MSIVILGKNANINELVLIWAPLFIIDLKAIYKCRALVLDNIIATILFFFISFCMINIECTTKTATYYVSLGHHLITYK